ncbi:hypothetical protein DL93DRAFT_2214012 [Clavulina sp. PMI_390]|nr:hypothetical protein DL93DRAFT_2214012 [Clavulina sp. PMI_390]
MSDRGITPGAAEEPGAEQPTTEQPSGEQSPAEQPEPAEGSTDEKPELTETKSERLARGRDELIKGKMKLEHSLGLGHKPNVIPAGEAELSGELRPVEIGWHPVAGFAGKWFAEKTGLGKLITEKIHKCPDPTQHWAILVGDYCHQLWMDEDLNVIYINEKLKREDWHTYPVGETRFNDEALRQAAEMVIFNMRAKRPAYNLISNNCQNFATLMLDSIHVGAHREFATAFSVYKRTTGRGKVSDLFINKLMDEEPDASKHGTAVQHAQQVMDENTTKLDEHHDVF